MALTILVIIVYICIETYGMRYIRKDSGEDFFDIRQTMAMRGCCIIVVFVHIPSDHGDLIQDLIGSFGYICVTLFFLISGYGLCWSIKNKKEYLDSFFRNRISALIIPFLVSCLFKTIAGFYVYSGGTAFIYVLLVFYLFVYIIGRFYKKNGWTYMICIGVGLYSFLGGSTGIGLGWYVEALGFAYGFLIAENIDRLKIFLSKNYLIRSLILSSLSLLCGLLYLKYKYVGFLGSYILRVLLGSLLVSCIICAMYKLQFGNRASLFLGKISYEIFLFHGFVMDMLIRIEKRYRVDISSGSFILLTIAFTVFIASISDRFNRYVVKMIRKS